MPMTIEEKQALFADELTRDFIETVHYVNGINRGRHQASPGVVQNTSNQLINVSSSAAGSFPVFGSIPSVLGAVANFAVNGYYRNKQDQRFSVVNMDVMNHLDTSIRDEIRKAALFLSRFFREFLDTKVHEKSIKTVADVMADRVFNHMSKVATEESSHHFWSLDEFLRGAFEGKSGRLKKTYRNTAVETQENQGLWQRWFHHHATTVEGLMTHTPFATKNDQGTWIIYANKGRINPLDKYGLAIFPSRLAEDRLKFSYQKIQPDTQEMEERQRVMAHDWEHVNATLNLTPTQSNETLSTTQARHEEAIETQDGRLESFEEALSIMGQSLETVQQDFLMMQGQQAKNHEELQLFFIQQNRKSRWGELNRALIHDQEINAYQRDVDEWLDDLETVSEIPLTAWVNLLVCLALEDYTHNLDLDLLPWELDLCTPQEPDLMKLDTLTVPFPVEKDHQICRWNNVTLKHYFVSLGLWQLYQTAKQHNLGEIPSVWREIVFLEPQVKLFLRYSMPPEAVTDLLADWQCTHQTDQTLAENILHLFSTHLPTCTCVFCHGRQALAEMEVKEAENLSRATIATPSREIHWIRLVHPHADRTRRDFHLGFSPQQPNYQPVMHSLLEPVAWHWSEAYLTQWLWQIVENELMNSPTPKTRYLAAFIPTSFNAHVGKLQREQESEDVHTQLLKDEQRYIEGMLTLLTLEDPELLDENRLFATYEEARRVHELCHERLKVEAKNNYEKQFRQPCSRLIENKLVGIVNEDAPFLDEYFLALQDGRHMASLIDALAPRFSAESDRSVSLLSERHRQSAYEEPGQSRTADLAQIKQRWKINLAAIQRRRQELIDLQTGRPLPLEWQAFSRDDVIFLLHLSLKALALTDTVIRNYVRGSSITQAEFNPSAPNNLLEEERLSYNLLRRQGTSPGTSPFSVDEDSPLNDRFFSDVFKPAVSPYEIWVRAKLFHRAYFLADREKNYPDTPLAKAGQSFERYNTQLNRVLDKLPAIEPLFAGRIGRVKTRELKADLAKWKQLLLERKAQVDRRLADHQERQHTHQQGLLYHAESHQIRFQALLNVMPPIIQEAYAALGHAKQTALMEGLVSDHRDRAIQWFCHQFYVNRAALFKAHVIEQLIAHFYPSVLPGVVTFDEKKAMQEKLQAGDFEAAFHLSRPRATLAVYQEAYEAQCLALLTEFEDTRRVFEKWTAEQQTQWLADSFRNSAAWERFSVAMTGQWYPLTHTLFESFLCQGLHPDAKNVESLLTSAIDYLLAGSSEDRKAALIPIQIERIYYLLDCGAVTQDWERLLEKIHAAYRVSPVSLKQNWFNLAATLILFSQLQQEPTSERTLELEIQAIQKKLNQYIENFTQEENSFWYQLLGKWWRSEEVRENRQKTFKVLKAHLNSIDINMSHFYQFFQFLEELKRTHKAQGFMFDSSRSKKLVNKSLQVLENFLTRLNVWREMSLRMQLPERELRRQVLQHPAQLALIPVGGTFQVKPRIFDQLDDLDPGEEVAHIRNAYAGLANVSKSAVEEKNQELGTSKTEMQRLEKENQELRKKLARLEREQEQKNNRSQPSRPSSRNWCTLS